MSGTTRKSDNCARGIIMPLLGVILALALGCALSSALALTHRATTANLWLDADTAQEKARQDLLAEVGRTSRLAPGMICTISSGKQRTIEVQLERCVRQGNPLPSAVINVLSQIETAPLWNLNAIMRSLDGCPGSAVVRPPRSSPKAAATQPITCVLANTFIGSSLQLEENLNAASISVLPPTDGSALITSRGELNVEHVIIEAPQAIILALGDLNIDELKCSWREGCDLLLASLTGTLSLNNTDLQTSSLTGARSRLSIVSYWEPELQNIPSESSTLSLPLLTTFSVALRLHEGE